MGFKTLASLSCLLAIMAVAHGGFNLAEGRETVWAGVSIFSGLAALLVVCLALRKRMA